MKKIFGIALSVVVMTSSVLPAYANTTPDWVKRSLTNSFTSTVNEINEKFYGDVNFVDKYNDTFDEFLTNMKGSHQLTYNTNNNYDESFGMGFIEEVATGFQYNDDGESILANFNMSTGDDGVSGSVYLDDYKIVVNVKELSDKPIVYNFGDDLTGLGIYDTELVQYLKYSNIKFYVNKFIDIVQMELIDELKEDYMNNLVENLLKSKITKEDNTITVEITGTLIKNYIKQLAVKIKADDRFDRIIDEIERIDAEKYYGLIDEFADMLLEEADYIDESYSIVYTGETKDGLLVKNTLDFNYEDETELTLIANFDFSNGLVGELKYEDSIYDETATLNFTVTETNGSSKLVAEVKYDDETLFAYDLVTKIDGINFESKGVVTYYQKPYFYVKEEPTKGSVKDYDQWIDEEGYKFTIIEEALVFAEKNIEESGRMLDDSVTGSVYVDLEDSALYSFMDYNCEYEDIDFFEMINFDDGKVERVEEYYYALVDYKAYLENELQGYTVEEIDEFLQYKYSEYVSNYNEDDYDDYMYDYRMKSYEEYLEFKNSGRDKDEYKIYLETKQNLSTTEMETESNASLLKNNKEQYSSEVDMTMSTSSKKNTIDTTNSMSINEFIELMNDMY